MSGQMGFWHVAGGNGWIWAEANFNDIQNSIRGRRYEERETLLTSENTLHRFDLANRN
jgi:hypothetical protein